MKSTGGTGGWGEGGRCLELMEAQPMHQPIIYCNPMHATPNPPKKWSGLTAPIIIWLHGFVSIKDEPWKSSVFMVAYVVWQDQA